MATEEKIDDIAEELNNILAQGIAVQPETLHFMESTYGFGAAKLETTLRDRRFEDQDVLLNLLFFPSIEMRVSIEPNLSKIILSTQEENTIIQKLVKMVQTVALRFSDGTSVDWKPDGSVLGVFVTKLYMTRGLDPEIVEAFNDHLPHSIAQRALVQIRCGNLKFSREATRFLVMFAKKINNQERNLDRLVLLVLRVLSHASENQAVEGCFIEAREYQKKLLEDINEFERKSKQYGIEYLMMQRYPIPTESIEIVSDRLHQLNVVCDVMGLSRYNQNYPGHRDLGSFNPERDMERLFKSLS